MIWGHFKTKGGVLCIQKHKIEVLDVKVNGFQKEAALSGLSSSMQGFQPPSSV